MTKANVAKEVVSITRQQFEQFCEKTVRGMRREHGDGDDLDHVPSCRPTHSQ